MATQKWRCGQTVKEAWFFKEAVMLLKLALPLVRVCHKARRNMFHELCLVNFERYNTTAEENERCGQLVFFLCS